jgi:xanthine/uracil permease
MPVLLALLLGFQQYVIPRHAICFDESVLILRFSSLAMLAGVITPPILIAGSSGANFGIETQQYLVSSSLIVCGILSLIQITRFHIKGTRLDFPY